MKGLSAMRLRSDGREERELMRNKDVIMIRRIDKEMNSVREKECAVMREECEKGRD